MGHLYTYDGADWVEVVGATGASGLDGSDGKTILNGAVDPTAEGVDGDFYINTADNTIFGPKAGGVWGTGTSIVGTDGADGAGVVAGGTTGQVLAKNSNTNYDTYWKDDAGGIADPSANGILARTALNTTSARTLTGTTNQISITNGDGVSGNPTFSTPQNIHTGASPTFKVMTLDNSSTASIGYARIKADATALTAQEAQLDLYSGATYARHFYRDSDKNYGFFVNGTTRIRIVGGTGEIQLNGNTTPYGDSTYTLGNSSNYWSNTYTDRLYLNSTAYLDGNTAGSIMLSGISQFQNANATIEYTTDHMSINKQASGNVYLFETGSIGDTTDGKEFRVYRNASEGIDHIAIKIDQYRNAFIYSSVGLLFRTTSSYGITFDGSGGNISFRDETYTDYVTFERTTRNLLIKKGSIVFSEGGALAVGTTTGTKIGTATNQKLGFFNATPVVRPSSTPANATDLATAITLVNDLKSKLVTLGLIA